MGYDQELFEQLPNSDFVCQICCDVLQKPMSACSEGHLFCHCCIGRWLDQGKTTCPSCRAGITRQGLSHIRAIQNIIDGLDICCPNFNDQQDCPPRASKRARTEPFKLEAPSSCIWKGKVKNLDQHTQHCPFEVVECPFKEHGCKFQCSRTDMPAHHSDSAESHARLAAEQIQKLQSETRSLNQTLQEVHSLTLKLDSFVLFFNAVNPALVHLYDHPAG
jgi:hypothetical protein